MLTVVVGFLDYVTGPDIAFSIFYLVPIALSSWYLGKAYGAAFSSVCALSWLAADLASSAVHFHPLVPYWNAIVMLGFFLVFSMMLPALRTALEHERALARTDYLTNAANSRFFEEAAAAEIVRASRYRHPFTVGYIDLDNFKTINDRYGHAVGDQLLEAVSASIRANLRQSDVLARLGGDEFAVLLPETGDEAAGRMIFGKIRDNLLQEMNRRGWPVTFSIGVAIYLTPPGTVDEMIMNPDGLMYSVKKNGKNAIKVRVYGGAPSESADSTT